MRILIVVMFVAYLCTACAFPRDPNATLERVRGGVMRVGLIESEPWVVRADDQPGGIEVELVRELASELDAEIQWIWGTEEALLDALEHYQLELVIGGLTAATPWRGRVGLTQSFFTEQVAVGIPGPDAALDDIEGVPVAVPIGSMAAIYVEKKDGVPVAVEEPARVDGPVAAPAWQLEQWGFVVTDVVLHEEEHVMAVPPGENRWLMWIEEFLRAHDSEVGRLLREELA